MVNVKLPQGRSAGLKKTTLIRGYKYVSNIGMNHKYNGMQHQCLFRLHRESRETPPGSLVILIPRSRIFASQSLVWTLEWNQHSRWSVFKLNPDVYWEYFNVVQLCNVMQLCRYQERQACVLYYALLPLNIELEPQSLSCKDTLLYWVSVDVLGSDLWGADPDCGNVYMWTKPISE